MAMGRGHVGTGALLTAAGLLLTAGLAEGLRGHHPSGGRPAGRRGRPRQLAALHPHAHAAALPFHPTLTDVSLLDEAADPARLAAIAADPRWQSAVLPTDPSVVGGYLPLVGTSPPVSWPGWRPVSRSNLVVDGSAPGGPASDRPSRARRSALASAWT